MAQLIRAIGSEQKVISTLNQRLKKHKVSIVSQKLLEQYEKQACLAPTPPVELSDLYNFKKKPQTDIQVRRSQSIYDKEDSMELKIFN